MPAADMPRDESRRTFFRPRQVLAWAILQSREWNNRHPTGVCMRHEHSMTAIPGVNTEQVWRR